MKKPESDFKSIENVLIEYLKRDFVKDAILLKGSWGSGKTFFIKNRVLDLIQSELDSPKIIYLPLFGAKNLEALKANLIVELLPDQAFTNFLKNGGFSVGLKLITAKLNIDVSNLLSSISFSSYLNKDKQYVFIFDDLERLDKNFEYSTLLGWINNLIEHNNIRTILIANELQIKSESYKSYKEKVIGTSILFKSENPYNDVIRKYSQTPALKNYIIKHKKIFDFIFTERCNSNLRIFEFGLNNLRYVLEVLENDIDERANNNKVQQILILTTMSISLEYKHDKINDVNKNTLYVEDEYDFDLDLIFDTLSKDEENQKVDLRSEIESNYFKRFGLTFTPINEILNLVVNGTFDKNKFRERVIQIAGLNKNESDQIFEELLSYHLINSIDDLEEKVTIAIEFLSHPSYDLRQTLSLMDIIFKLSNLSLIENDITELKEEFIDILKTNAETFEYYDALEYYFEKTDRPYGNQFSDVVKIGLQINEQSLDSIKREVKKDFFKEFKINTSNLTSLVYELGHQNNMIFDVWDVNETAKHLIKTDNHSINSFKNFIQSRYSGNIELYKQERDFLSKLKSQIKNSLDGVDKLKVLNLNSVIDQIDMYEKMYKQNVS